MNTVFCENVYFAALQRFYCELKQVVLAAAVDELLDLRGVPRGSVIYSCPVKKYTAKDGSLRTYQYTNSYLYIAGKVFYISKKYPYPADRRGRDRNDASNPDNHLLLEERLLLRMQVRAALKHFGKAARARCNFLNAHKSKALRRIVYPEALAEARADFRASEEYLCLQSALDHVLVCGPEAWQNDGAMLSEIFNEYGQRLASKNEVIAARCLRDCGCSFDLEPQYPASNYRADFLLRTGGRAVWLEIAGKRTDPSYERTLQAKRRLAREHGLPLVVVDMTDYPGPSGEPKTRLHYNKLQRIFQNIRLGLLPREIVTPY